LEGFISITGLLESWFFLGDVPLTAFCPSFWLSFRFEILPMELGITLTATAVHMHGGSAR